MTWRLFKKSVLLSVRSKRRFIAFTAMYLGLIIWMSSSLYRWSLAEEGVTDLVLWSFLISLVVSTFLSVIYAFVIVNSRRVTIATLKCIGYTNKNVLVMIIGEVIWVTLVALIFALELLIHMVAIQDLLNLPSVLMLFDPISLFLTVLLFMLTQSVGMYIIYRRVLKLRPIVALRIMK